MNVKTDRIDNHKAQFTVEIEAQQLDEAKRKAAKKLSRQVRIKGFRKGKAPYRIIAQFVGEAAILEEAVELLGNDIYKHALEESEIEPYGPGLLDDFKIEPAPTFIFSVPLQPEVDLKDYLDVRLDFEQPEVSDEDVGHAIEHMRQQEADVDEDGKVVAVGNRVTVDIHSEFVDGEEPDDNADEDEHEDQDDTEVVDADEDEENEDDEPYIPRKGDHFVHRHDATVMLDEDNEPFMPGFIAGLVGAELDEEVQFELTAPEDGEDYKDIAGRKVSFHVTIKKIEILTLPELNDEFATMVSEANGDDAMTLEELRTHTREDLEKEAMRNAKSEYGDQVLEKIVEGAEIAYPEPMVDERIDDMLRDLDNNLQQQGMNLDTYMRITGTAPESLREQYHDNAVDSVKRTLVLRELLTAQNVEMGDEQIEKRLDTMMMQFGAQGDQFRSLIDTPQMRENILNELLMDNIMTRLIAVGQGQDPDTAVVEREAEIEADNEKARERVEKMMAAQEAMVAEEAGEELENGEAGENEVTIESNATDDESIETVDESEDDTEEPEDADEVSVDSEDA